MKKQFSITPLSILLTILLSGVLYSSIASAMMSIDLGGSNIGDLGIGDLGVVDAGVVDVGIGDVGVGDVGVVDVGIGDIGIGDIPEIPNFCGDGRLGGDEQCDDGNAINTDACVNCQNAACGDGYTRGGYEECDDGNNTSGDGCSSSCNAEICGNGRVDYGEECDDGNTENYDVCNNNCEERQLGPTGNPPLGGITPIFSGLIVDGLSTLLNLDVNGTLDVNGNALFDYIQLNGIMLMQNPGELWLSHLHASGDITTSYGSIGSHYTVWRSNTVTLNGFHESAIVGCFGGDEMTGCSGYFDHDSSNDRFAGSYIGGLLGPDTDDEEYCITEGANGGGSNDTVYSTARCFDPTGNRHGKYERTTY